MSGKSFTRRGFVSMMAASGAALLAACAAPAATPTTAPAVPTATTAAAAPAPTATTAAAVAAPTATTAAGAPTATTAAKPTVAAVAPTAKPLAPTATTVPLLQPVPQPAGTTKLLTRVHWEGNRLNDFLKYINMYNTEQGPTDKVYMVVERQVAEIQGFISDFQAGTQEDAYHLNDGYLADLAARNFFESAPTDVVNYIKQTYYEASVGTGTIAGKVLGYPTENQPHVMFLNKKLFAAAGLDATKDYPKSWDDIRTLSKKLNIKTAGKNTQAGWILHNIVNPTGPDVERGFIQRLMFQFLEGDPLVDATTTPPKINITGPGARKFTQLLADLTADASTNADMGNADIIWAQEKGAMHTQDAWAIVYQLVQNGRQGILDDTFTTGVISSDGKKTGNMSRNYHWLVSTKGKNKDLAWKFLKWMNEGPKFYMQEYMTDIFGFVPTVKGQKMPKVFNAQTTEAFNASMATPYQTAMPVIKGLRELEKILRDADDALTLGKLTADAYTTRLDGEFKAAMQKSYS